MAGFKEGALQLRRKNELSPSDPGFIKVYCDVSGSLYTVNEFGVSAYLTGSSNSSVGVSTGVFGGSPSLVVDSLSATISPCNIILNNSNDYSGEYKAYSIISDTVALQDIFDCQYVCVKIESNNAKLVLKDNLSIVNGSNIVPLFVVWKDVFSSEWHNIYYGTNGSGLPNKILDSILNTTQLRVASTGSLKLTEYPTRNINVTSCEVYFGINKIVVPSFNSSINNMFELVYDGSNWDKFLVTQYNNTQYNSNTGKTSLGVGNYGVRWFYSLIDDSTEVFYTLGTNSYASISQAQLEDPPENLPSYISQRSLLIGRIIICNGASSGIIEGAFGKFQFKPLSTNHNSLDGLQGGASGEYYHLTHSDYIQLTTSAFANNHNHTFTYNQNTPATLWPISHNLGRVANVEVYVSNQKVEPSIAYTDYNNTILSFSVALTGVAILT